MGIGAIIATSKCSGYSTAMGASSAISSARTLDLGPSKRHVFMYKIARDLTGLAFDGHDDE